MSISDIFETQAVACAGLGSTFTADVLRAASTLLPQAGVVGQRILNWPGDASVSADSVPLRLAGGLHALVLTGQDAELMAVYPPDGQQDDSAGLQNAIRAALHTHSEPLLRWLDSPPQTNESARSAPLVAVGGLLSDQFGLPLKLLELGASAGLNLRWDKVALALFGHRIGPPDAGLVLSPDWRGPLPSATPIRVASRAGVDLNPLDPTNRDDQLRLMSYIWPDQPDRLSRMRQALDLACALPVEITKADAIDWLQGQLAEVTQGVTTVVYHTVAWQYFPTEIQARGQRLIEQAGAKATATAPLAWFGMENDGSDRPGAELTLRIWPENRRHDLGRADFHGRWVDWKAG